MASKPAEVADGMSNVITGVGTASDKRSYDTYRMMACNVVTQVEAEAAYRTSWLTRKAHDLPPFDMTRAGRDWQAEKEQITKLEAEERRLGVWPKVREALTLARLHGGGAIILGVGDANPSKALPANIQTGGLKYLNVVSRHQLTYEDLELDPTAELFGQPKLWKMGGSGKTVEIHPSRVIPFIGQPLPKGVLAVSEQFWGDPLLQIIKDAVTNADLSQNGVASLLHEAKIDTLSIPGLTELVSTSSGEARLMKRLQVAALAKSIMNTLVIEGGAEGQAEKWETRQISFTGLPDVIQTFLQIVAAATDIPVTRLLGTSAKGLNATGEGDADNYDEMIGARQEMDLRPCLNRLDELLIPSALGARPAEIYYAFSPLSSPKPKDEALIEKTRAETVKIIADTQLVPDSALAKATQNAMVESGNWPGLDAALLEAEKASEVAGILEAPTPAELAAEALAATGQQAAVAGAKAGAATAKPKPAAPPNKLAANDALTDDERRSVLDRLWRYLVGEKAGE